VRQVDQPDVAGGPLDQSADRRCLTTTDDQITFPVARDPAFVDFQRALADQGHVLDLVEGGDASPLALAAAPAGTEPAGLASE
jgi:hypothetical protein